MIVLVGNEKGGTGKTTLAVNLAAMRAAEGHDVLLVDCDPMASATAWCGARDEVAEEMDIPRFTSIQKLGKTVYKAIVDLSSKYEDIIIDAGGRDSVEMRGAMSAADICLVPARPSQLDVWALQRVAGIIANAKVSVNPDLDTLVVLCMASTHPAESKTREAREFLEDIEEYDLARTVVYSRTAYQDCFPMGLSVCEYDPTSKACAEMELLYQEVFDA